MGGVGAGGELGGRWVGVGGHRGVLTLGGRWVGI